MGATIKIKPNFLKRIASYTCGFILIYYINLLPNINPYIFPLIVFFIITLMEIVDRNNSVFTIAKKKKYALFIIGLVLAALYYVFIYFIMNESISLYGSRIIQSLMFVIYFFIVMFYVKKIHILFPTREEKLELLFRIATIQGIICIIMLIVPNFKHLADSLFVAASHFEEGDYILGTRVFGISNSYTYGLPIFHGLLCGICFYMSMMIDKKYFKYLPFVAVVSILNGRTGIIVALITVLMGLAYAFCMSKNKIRVMSLSLLAIVITVSVFGILSSLFPQIYGFVGSAFNSIGEFVSGDNTSESIKALTGDFVYLPEGTALIFGDGKRLYATVNETEYASSDIGFVNDLFMGGLIYAILLYGSYIMIIMSSFTDKRYRFIRYLIIVTLIIANWKGEIFKNSLFIIGLFFVLLSDISLEGLRGRINP